MGTIGLINQKGGVGKTTLSICIASGLRKLGKTACLIDTDPQGSLRDWHSISKEQNSGDTYPVFSADMKGLPELISNLQKDFDCLIIDGAPRSDRMASIIIRLCDLVLIPVTPSGLDAWASSDIVEPIQIIQEKNKGKPKSRFIINRARQGTILKQEIYESIQDYGIPIMDSICNHREAYAQTLSEGLTIFDSKNIGAKTEATEISNEVLRILQDGN